MVFASEVTKASSFQLAVVLVYGFSRTVKMLLRVNVLINH